MKPIHLSNRRSCRGRGRHPASNLMFMGDMSTEIHTHTHTRCRNLEGLGTYCYSDLAVVHVPASAFQHHLCNFITFSTTMESRCLTLVKETLGVFSPQRRDLWNGGRLEVTAQQIMSSISAALHIPSLNSHKMTGLITSHLIYKGNYDAANSNVRSETRELSAKRNLRFVLEVSNSQLKQSIPP